MVSGDEIYSFMGQNVQFQGKKCTVSGDKM